MGCTLGPGECRWRQLISMVSACGLRIRHTHASRHGHPRRTSSNWQPGLAKCTTRRRAVWHCAMCESSAADCTCVEQRDQNVQCGLAMH